MCLLSRQLLHTWFIWCKQGAIRLFHIIYGSSLAYFMMTHPLPIAGKMPIKTLVAKQLPTSNSVAWQICNMQTSYSYCADIMLHSSYFVAGVWIRDHMYIVTVTFFFHRNTLNLVNSTRCHALTSSMAVRSFFCRASGRSTWRESAGSYQSSAHGAPRKYTTKR